MAMTDCWQVIDGPTDYWHVTYVALRTNSLHVVAAESLARPFYVAILAQFPSKDLQRIYETLWINMQNPNAALFAMELAFDINRTLRYLASMKSGPREF
ncbi:hypothetical protein [Anatilimnocola aggregata]|nr:hypothetical protein [Anatilimnocola aggregata]